jgi:hypothetical protein
MGSQKDLGQHATFFLVMGQMNDEWFRYTLTHLNPVSMRGILEMVVILFDVNNELLYSTTESRGVDPCFQ